MRERKGFDIQICHFYISMSIWQASLLETCIEQAKQCCSSFVVMNSGTRINVMSLSNVMKQMIILNTISAAIIRSQFLIELMLQERGTGFWKLFLCCIQHDGKQQVIKTSAKLSNEIWHTALPCNPSHNDNMQQNASNCVLSSPQL